MFAALAANAKTSGDPPEVALAEEARALLSMSHHEAGFGSTKECKLVWKQPKPKKGQKTPPQPVQVQVCTSVPWFNVTLAVKRGTEPFKVIKVNGDDGSSKSQNFETGYYVNHLGQGNGVNTEFFVKAPSGYCVFAIRRWVNQGGKKTEVVYTPYSDCLNTKDVRASGYLYVSKLVEDAKRELNAKGVRSAANPTALVGDRVPTETVIRLAIIEHVDHFRFKKEGIKQPASEALVVYALNRHIAYRYSKSTAGARGLLQFMPKTYASLVKKYPKAELITDFHKAVLNNHNMAKAAILLIDDGMSQLPLPLRQKVFADVSLFEDFSASGYNGGVNRPRTILLAGGDLVRNNRNDENQTYVAKLRALRAHPRLW